MKKKSTRIVLTVSAIIGAIYCFGYGYIFKALGLNLAKGPITPSTDDEEKFPSRNISNFKADKWRKHHQYNSLEFSQNLWDELKKTRASSFLIIKDQQILHEKYWKNHTQHSLINSFSMTKGFMSILVGFAIDDGFLTSEDQLVSTVFPHYAENHFGKHLTFRHLMTMQGGFDWNEEYHHPFAENSKQYFVDDLNKQVFDTGFKNMPGEKYEYQSICAQLLGMALSKILKQTLSDYMSQKLWKPLGMESDAKWSTDEQGMEKTFCCLHATPRDLAKIGQFVMQEGQWKGKQLLSKEYCKRMLTPTVSNDVFCYNIWADTDSEIEYRFFYGFLGQFIIMIPEKNLVIVKTGFYNRLEVDKKSRPVQVKILINEILANY